MKVVTAITVWNDAVGKRMSAAYTEIDDSTGRIISDNKRFDRVITDASITAAADTLKAYAQSLVDGI